MTGAISVETVGLTKRFGGFTALEDVSMKVDKGEFHALLGENGAGKSTLVKAIIGYHKPTAGSVLVNNHEIDVDNPKGAHALGVGMVYQHFTLVPSMTVAENLVMSRSKVPAVIEWRAERKKLDEFMQTMPFQAPLDRLVSDLAAGEKQKTEILKQLYLERRFLILDEPTSVLTPGEADEMLSLMRDLTVKGELSILLITHKFREVSGFADKVTVLRRGRMAGSGDAKDLSRKDMAAMMIGAGDLPPAAKRLGKAKVADAAVLMLRELRADDETGTRNIHIEDLSVRPQEILGIAGVSGNGQKVLIEVLGGQRSPVSGEMLVHGKPYGATRSEARAGRVRCLPEEPLRNACAPRMSVTENLSFRTFDVAPDSRSAVWLNARGLAGRALELIARYGVKTASPHSAIETLSGGNVQRAVLARELDGKVDLLVVANPCFGLDFAAVADIRGQIMEARNNGAAVLLVSEDLDELLELSDRIAVMSEGKVVFETPIESADVQVIGSYMAGRH